MQRSDERHLKGGSPNIKTFYKDQVIFKENQESNVAYMVRKGTVNIFRVMNNKKVILDRLSEGEIFGEMGIITGGVRSASAEAAEYCELMVLTHQVLFNLINQSPRTIQILTKALIRRLRRTTSLIPDQSYESSFLSICKILELLYKLHLRMPMEERKREANYDLGLNYISVCKQIKDIILVSQSEIENVLNKLANLKVISFTAVKNQRAVFADRYIQIADINTFMTVAGNLHKELQKTDYSLVTENEYVDIMDFCELIEAEPEIIYKKMANMEVPEALLFFNRPRAMEWADNMGADFFKKVVKRKKKPEDLEDVNDVVYVDNKTLKEVFEKLGYYKLGILISVAEEEARAKITSNLSKKIASVVIQEADGRDFVDDSEAEDIQEELIALIQEVKGVSR